MGPPPNSNTIFPNQIEIDYVRVYEQNGIVGCTDSNANNYNPNARLIMVVVNTLFLFTWT